MAVFKNSSALDISFPRSQGTGSPARSPCPGSFLGSCSMSGCLEPTPPSHLPVWAAAQEKELWLFPPIWQLLLLLFGPLPCRQAHCPVTKWRLHSVHSIRAGKEERIRNSNRRKQAEGKGTHRTRTFFRIRFSHFSVPVKQLTRPLIRPIHCCSQTLISLSFLFAPYVKQIFFCPSGLASCFHAVNLLRLNQPIWSRSCFPKFSGGLEITSCHITALHRWVFVHMCTLWEGLLCFCGTGSIKLRLYTGFDVGGAFLGWACGEMVGHVVSMCMHVWVLCVREYERPVLSQLCLLHLWIHVKKIHLSVYIS